MRHVALLGILTAACAWPALAAPLTPPELLKDIHQQGPRNVVAQLSAGNGAQWTDVLNRISMGNDEWLAVAAALRPGTDAGTGEDLTGALAYALLKNPQGVLPLTGGSIPLEAVCNVPLIEPTDAQVAKWKAEALTALSRVKATSLAREVAACRADFLAVPVHQDSGA
ncbi:MULTISPECIES: hypothetical protein [unclassified Acidocella]|uniref:hypothetical protein n=1 Tax=unclassified Acidocella TaxID=2648610 RepID=UPI00028D95C5|nr:MULTISPECIES: hypothetical protein [unclassified Acidocella]EKN00805.1 hypothetical protein MXAZACID_03474 [Acidocella sp. MX-AZ02]WBO60339.1 hypothetical protein GT370_05905 [Acidocella sp. MX-AZ03]